MIVVKRALPRRTVLRGIGATMALPFLDAMVPAVTAASRTAAKPIKRIGFFYRGNGTIPSRWVPPTVGRDFELSQILEPLAPVREYLTVVSGLAHRQADSFGDGNGDHTRGNAVWLTGVHAYDRRTSEVKLATTVDQLIARHVGATTRLASLELALDGGNQSSCDSGDCFYSSSISWRSPTTPNPVEHQPRVVFERLFGEGSTPEERRVHRLNRKSLLDAVAEEARRFKLALGPGDVLKLDEYLESVRDIERRIQHAESESEQSFVPEAPASGVPDTMEAHWALMCDLQILAFLTDATRVTTMMMTREGNYRAYPQIGVHESGHSCSHHRRQTDLMDKRTKILTHHETLHLQFLQKLRDTPDGDGSLLDHSIIVTGGGLGDGDMHDHVNLPVCIAGKAAGRLQGNVHVAFEPAKEIPMANLLLTLMDLMDAEAPDSIGDSTGHVTDRVTL